MFRFVMAGAWSCLVALGSVYLTQEFRGRRGARLPVASPSSVETRKTREINVPRIADGAVKGYVVVSFAYVVVQGPPEAGDVSPDPYVVEEAFRFIYDDDSIDFAKPRKFDFKSLTDAMRKNVNSRLKKEVIRDVVLQELHFIPSAELRQKM